MRAEVANEALHRPRQSLAAVDDVDDPVVTAERIAFRVTRARAFGEGNKRTALLLAKWTPDRNGLDGPTRIAWDDYALADLLVEASAGSDVEGHIMSLLAPRGGTP